MSLLIWKISLTIFGGFDQAHTIKNKKRITEGLPTIGNPMETINKLTPVVAPIDVMNLNEDENLRQKPKLRLEFQRYEDESGESFFSDREANEGIIEDERPATPVVGTLGRGTPRPSLTSRIVYYYKNSNHG